MLSINLYKERGSYMDYEAKRKVILKKMARINCMEKGKLSEEYRESCRDGKTVELGPYYKHQCWTDGRNVSRRVPVSEVQHLRKAVDGYHEFEKLSKEYAEVTIAMTRQTKSDDSKKKLS